MLQNPNRVDVYAQRDIRARRINIVVMETVDGEEFMLQTMRMAVQDMPQDTSFQKQITMGLPSEAAQQLMDELWHAGIRPTNGEGNVGQIGAMASHLKDMQTIAFKLLEVPKEVLNKNK